MGKSASESAQMVEVGLPFRSVGTDDEFVDDSGDRRVAVSSPRTLSDGDQYCGDNLPKNWFSWRKYVQTWALCVRVEHCAEMPGSFLSQCPTL